jgi:hypothetical protein
MGEDRRARDARGAAGRKALEDTLKATAEAETLLGQLASAFFPGEAKLEPDDRDELRAGAELELDICLLLPPRVDLRCEP